MDAPLPITLVFTAVFVLLSIPMAVAVGLRRAKTGILMLHGEDDDLLKRIRAHANFTEYVPLALLAMAGAELAGAPGWLLIGAGIVLLAARLLHYTALRGTGTGHGRTFGAGLTSLTMAVLGVTILLYLGGVAG
ncbi:MAPEG family protein [Ovoidimarina sediminis]|uniref:MAPEG family protein n=1 Tax=Ovoidimarina sediminis TaxID=3079856 RepID=UPI0029084B35|nr:MAPEG family protein [Rhodophyticola sp. MJ-SS7]MDU8946633.1 MAPEG family protein [Rhodophyticola sp. MJ-SS7]